MLEEIFILRGGNLEESVPLVELQNILVIPISHIVIPIPIPSSKIYVIPIPIRFLHRYILNIIIFSGKDKNLFCFSGIRCLVLFFLKSGTPIKNLILSKAVMWNPGVKILPSSLALLGGNFLGRRK